MRDYSYSKCFTKSRLKQKLWVETKYYNITIFDTIKIKKLERNEYTISENIFVDLNQLFHTCI